jgi:hypothetical protein
MSFLDLEFAAKLTAARFLEKYRSMIDDIVQLRSDIGSDRWGDESTNDPAVWFEWVQAFWEVRGATFSDPVSPGPNAFTIKEGLSATLDVPYDGSNPTITPGLDIAHLGAERDGLDKFRTVLEDWSGSLLELQDALSQAGRTGAMNVDDRC